MKVIDSSKLKTILKVLCECGCGNSLVIQKGIDFWVFEFTDNYDYNFIDKVKMKFKYEPPAIVVDRQQISEMLIYLQHYVSSIKKINWPDSNETRIPANFGELQLYKLRGRVVIIPNTAVKVKLFGRFKNKAELILEQDEFEKFVLLLRSTV